jgi:hypothetical protein
MEYSTCNHAVDYDLLNLAELETLQVFAEMVLAKVGFKLSSMTRSVTVAL